MSRTEQVVRTIRQPATLLGPAASLGRRAITGSYWAESVTVSTVAPPQVETEGLSELQGVEDGAGPLNRRRYRISIAYPSLTATELIERFCTEPNRFSPTEFAVFLPEPGEGGLVEGDRITVELPGPWDGPVLVTDRTETSLRFETRQGHMEAGWIEFRASDVDSNVVFEIESVARSGDVVFDVIYHRLGLGKLVQTDMWVRVLEAAADLSGGSQLGRVLVDTTVFEKGSS